MVECGARHREVRVVHRVEGPAQNADRHQAAVRATRRVRGIIEARPRIGPGSSSRNSHCAPRISATELSSWMLKIVMAKPMQLAIVSAEPTRWRGALCALSAENCGESPTTTTPQNSRKAR